MKTKQCLPILLLDYYKTTHAEQYSEKLNFLVSYFTPRMSRVKENKLIHFGLQAVCKDYLIDYFNDYFFNLPKEQVIEECRRTLDNTLGSKAYNIGKYEDLHDLGYLPIEIKSLPEGTRVPVGVPMFEISNTHPNFAWVVNSIESLVSAELWHTMLSANVGYDYRQIVNRFYDISVDDDVTRSCALGDFSFRGQQGQKASESSSSAFCLSFLNTATVPALNYLERNYNCDCEKEDVIFGSISYEHSVVCSHYAIDGDEITGYKRALTETYPDQTFSMVCDSYNYNNVLENILPALKDIILNRKGTLLVRGDSGDPVDIVTNTVFSLWDTFGGTVNSKGYKVLDPHVRAIYGDSITQNRLKKIYQILVENGFACNNAILGVGSFSMQCLEEEKFIKIPASVINEQCGTNIPEDTFVEYKTSSLKPYTRDTFGIAIKTTYGETVDGQKLFILKDPVTDIGHFKKSQKGMCCVYLDDDGSIKYKDQLYRDDDFSGNLLETVFKNGKMIKEQTLDEIRNILHNDTKGF